MSVYNLFTTLGILPFLIAIIVLNTFKFQFVWIVIRLGKVLYKNRQARVSHPSRIDRSDAVSAWITKVGPILDARRYSRYKEMGEDA